MSNLPITIASTIQSASINRSPSPRHDLNPSTAASQKTPVSPTLASSDGPPPAPSSSFPPSSSSSSSSPPTLATHPTPRRRPRPNTTTMPPLPDLRFEQSYLASIRHTSSNWEIAWITARDQVMMPLVQGLLWTLLVQGWRYWNRGVKLQGAGVGARVRRWWWGVNRWEVPV